MAILNRNFLFWILALLFPSLCMASFTQRLTVTNGDDTGNYGLTINPGVGGGTGVESYSPSGPQVLSSGQTVTFVMEIANVTACNGTNSTCSLDFSYGIAGLSGGYYGGFTCVFQQMMTADQIDCNVNVTGGAVVSVNQSDSHAYMTISPGSDLKAKK